MLNIVCISLALFGLTACGSPVATDSGIQGRVTAGPTCPVERPDMLCPDLPYAAKLSILSSPDRRTVASVKADESGDFTVLLPPGTYIIHPESPGVMPFASELVVQVRPHEFTLQDIVYDTGIR